MHLCTDEVALAEIPFKELENTGSRTWGEAKRIANNRVTWKAMVEALCLSRGKEVSVKLIDSLNLDILSGNRGTDELSKYFHRSYRLIRSCN